MPRLVISFISLPTHQINGVSLASTILLPSILQFAFTLPQPHVSSCQDIGKIRKVLTAIENDLSGYLVPSLLAEYTRIYGGGGHTVIQVSVPLLVFALVTEGCIGGKQL